MFLLDKILSSNSTVIGYDSRNESNVFKILSNIPRIIFCNEELSNEEILEYISSKSFLREVKINLLFDNDVYFVFDLNKFILSDFDGVTKSLKVRNCVSAINSILYQFNNSESYVKIHAIYLASIYRGLKNEIQIISGSSVLYEVDTCFTFFEDSLYFVKDRHKSHSTYEDIEIKSPISVAKVMREISIDNILK